MTPPIFSDLKQLAKLLDRSHPQVVIVVGTGIAINATGQPHASWLGLLKHGIRHLVQKQFQPRWGVELEASLDAAFSPFHLQSALQHAELVERALNTPNENAFARWLDSAFANFKTNVGEKARAPLEALRDLHEAGALLLTTNYDSLLSDITGVPPVTWEEHSDFHRVMTRQKPGILHIHGHWQRPSSIVLGRTSYNRVVADEDLQQLFKTLWLEWTWVYVGCGNGLDDPNIGRLLEWSKGWGVSALPDFFLAQADKATDVANRPNKPPNLFSIGYPSHDDLPSVLRAITPAARCWPFVRIDDEFPFFRVPGSSIPFPTRKEYLDGNVPTLGADAEVQKRLQTHGWACVMDVASVGKTTLALRAATTPEQQRHPAFYLDLKEEILDEDAGSPAAALQRLSRPGTLLIFDNAHHQPGLARRLWQQWNAKPPESRGSLLLVATRIHQPVVVTPEQDLSFFERHPANPAIVLKPTPEDLGRLAKHIYYRVGGTKYPPMPDPPPAVLDEWHRDYRAAMNAFTFGVLNSLDEFRRGNWSLPMSRVSAWVREKWLNQLQSQELDNVACLAVFGAQHLEMTIANEALPHPDKTSTLFELGLVTQTRLGRLKQYRHLSLREPGWGRLILEALDPPRNSDQILYGTVTRSPSMAVVMSARLRNEGLTTELGALWESLAANRDALASKVFDLRLTWLERLLLESDASNQTALTFFLIETIEAQPGKFADCALESHFQDVVHFTEILRDHCRETAWVWEALERHPDRVAQKGIETPPLGLVALGHRAPLSLFEIALRNIKPGHWDTIPLAEGLLGATWIAWRCSSVKRDDLASDLIALLLRRSNWRDFAPQGGGFGQACWLLANTSPMVADLVQPFCKTVCNEKWLGVSYAVTACGQLASGLRQLAFHQTPELCRRFHHSGLGWRIHQELTRFEAATSQEQSQTIQFLGCASLCGWHVSRRNITNIKSGAVLRLPLNVLPHRSEASWVEDHQLQLWLGLRAFVSIRRESLPAPHDTIEQTLKLWRANLERSSSTPTAAAHRVNESMVMWLETCLRADPPAMMPSKEALWMPVRFSVQQFN